MAESPFTRLPRSEWTSENELAFAVRDQHPVSPGHTLVISKRVVPTWFDATADEQRAILELIDQVKRALDEELHPDGYNIGFNAGTAAGQTVMHLHVHVIPRFSGDTDDPRGGVRHVIPSRGNYLRNVRPLATGGEDDPFAHHIRPLFAEADEIEIVAAFVQSSGLEQIRPDVEQALARGACIRILTGTYLAFTQADALEQLYDWERESGMEEEEEPDEKRGRLLAKVVVVESLPGFTRSFHPKSWRFESARFGTAFVGSSNLSKSALGAGIEWNLPVDRDRDRESYQQIVDAFEKLWAIARSLDPEWIAAYAAKARLMPHALPPGELEEETLETAPEPHSIQREALDALREGRENGRTRALVVLATGLGKTWLAAFDYLQLHEELGGALPRILFLAHRRELLRQAARTFRCLLRTHGLPARVGWFVEEASDLSADLVFASVAKLARPEHLAKLRNERFDYVVVDEVHHAAADSYRRILDALTPRFLLGLTATPDRADEADVAGLFDDHIACRADIGAGIAIGRLVPFHYFGVKDDIDYENIPWRNRRWDPELLARAAQTEARMQTLWRAWEEHAAGRSLVFCCSVAHAIFVKKWLAERGVGVRAVFSAEGSDDREDALRELSEGKIAAVCAVDMFNEGVDLPALDRVVMLRPTESSVVFLQQLGRGLRASVGKAALTIIDFVGNHRVFLERLRKLLSLGGGAALGEFLGGEGPIDLPAGCSVDVEVEAKEMLSRIFRVGGADEVERAYRELRLTRDERPTAGELFRMGYPPRRLRDRHGSWFDFVRTEGDLDPEEVETLETAGAFFRELEGTEMTKSFKMVTLQALLDADALTSGLELGDLAARAHAILRRSPELSGDIDEDRFDALDDGNRSAWLSYWKKHPIDAWTNARKDRRAWFRLEGTRFLLDAFDSAAPALGRMGRELVDLRLAEYRARRRQTATAEGFVCKVTWNKRDPILKLPTRRVATEETDVRLPDGSVWMFRFAKEFCNVARPAGARTNQLPDLLRRWFGPRAGQPGTAFEVRFIASPDGLWAEPVQGQVIDLAARNKIVAYPDLRAAAGHAVESVDDPEAELVLLPVERAEPDLFAVRVSGTSMDGGAEPLSDGDWAVMRLARGAPAEALVNRVVLFQVPAKTTGSQYQIKRLVSREGRWLLSSDNPSGPTIEATDETISIARLERALRPEDLGPTIGSRIHEDELAAGFGLEDVMPRSGRHGGHLFIVVDQKEMLVAQDRVRFIDAKRRPGETAFVLARAADTERTWRYLGVGRFDEADNTWRIPEVDYSTWRAFGAGKSVSRELPDGALERAQIVADALVAIPEVEIEQADGRRARVLGRATRGGLRIGGDFEPRTVSLIDLGWVIVASDDVREHGGLLDQARVNRLRYLEGAPEGSTRWIDTGWAIAAWIKGQPLARIPVGSRATGARHVRRADGTLLDAEFLVEREQDVLTIVIESRGGTRGSKEERNTDYNEGLELILARLGELGANLADVTIESRSTKDLQIAERRLSIEGRSFPIEIDDAGKLRRAIGSAQSKTGRRAGAKGGGNQNKRLRIVVGVRERLSVDALAETLELGAKAISGVEAAP